LGLLVAMGFDRLRSINVPLPLLGVEDKADLALAQADRILSLLETILGLVGVILPLALGVVVYIFQQNRRVIEDLTDKAEEARRDAANSKARVEELNAETRGLDSKVREAVGKINGAIEQDKLREEALNKLQASVQTQRFDVNDALLEAQQASKVAVFFRELITVRKLEVMVHANKTSDSIMAVYTLRTLFDRNADKALDEDNAMLRVEAIRTFSKIADLPAISAELHAEFSTALAAIADDATEALVVRTQAMRVLQTLNRRATNSAPQQALGKSGTAQDDPNTKR
jgi:hypothetical protein